MTSFVQLSLDARKAIPISNPFFLRDKQIISNHYSIYWSLPKGCKHLQRAWFLCTHKLHTSICLEYTRHTWEVHDPQSSNRFNRSLHLSPSLPLTCVLMGHEVTIISCFSTWRSTEKPRYFSSTAATPVSWYMDVDDKEPSKKVHASWSGTKRQQGRPEDRNHHPEFSSGTLMHFETSFLCTT